jgi:opacity protein-like surface antigen
MFKQLIVAALAALTLTAAQARDIAWIGNQSGGQIIIQNYTCPWTGWGNLYQAYNTSPSGQTQMGCWYLE